MEDLTGTGIQRPVFHPPPALFAAFAGDRQIVRICGMPMVHSHTAMASQKNRRFRTFKTWLTNSISQVRASIAFRVESRRFSPVVSNIDSRCSSAPERMIWHFPRREELMKAQVPLNHLKGVGVSHWTFTTISFRTSPFWQPHSEE